MNHSFTTFEDFLTVWESLDYQINKKLKKPIKDLGYANSAQNRNVILLYIFDRLWDTHKTELLDDKRLFLKSNLTTICERLGDSLTKAKDNDRRGQHSISKNGHFVKKGETQ